MRKEKNTTTISLANTPVQRALRKSRKTLLALLFAVGIAAGFVYKAYFAEKQAGASSPAVAEQRP